MLIYAVRGPARLRNKIPTQNLAARSGKVSCCYLSNLWRFWWWEWCESGGPGCVTLWVRLHSASKSAWVDHDKYVKKRSAPPRTLGHLIYSLGSYSEQGHAKVPSISFNFYLSTIPSKKIFCAQNFCFQKKFQLDLPNLTRPVLTWLDPTWFDIF